MLGVQHVEHACTVPGVPMLRPLVRAFGSGALRVGGADPAQVVLGRARRARVSRPS